MKEEDIVRLYQRGTSARLGPRRTDCVTPDEMVAVVERLGSEDDRLKTINHAMACADCADELELLRSMRIVKERARLPRFGYAVAASAVLVIGLGYYNLARSRAPAERGVLRDAASDVQLVAPIAPTVPQLDTLVWRAVDNATGYVVEVRRGDGTLVGRTATTLRWLRRERRASSQEPKSTGA